MSAQPLAIRLANLSDTEIIHCTHTSAVRNLCSAFYTELESNGWLKNCSPNSYIGPIEKGNLFVAERHKKILGFGEAIPGTVIAVYVAPEHTGKGVGGRLLCHAITLAGECHSGPIRLESTLNARKFCEHAGFKVICDSSAKRNGVEIPVVMMERAAT